MRLRRRCGKWNHSFVLGVEISVAVDGDVGGEETAEPEDGGCRPPPASCFAEIRVDSFFTFDSSPPLSETPTLPPLSLSLFVIIDGMALNGK